MPTTVRVSARALTPDGDDGTARPPDAHIAYETLCPACHFPGWEIDPLKADYLAATFDGADTRVRLLDLAPRFAVDGGLDAAKHSYTIVLRFDSRRFGRRWHGRRVGAQYPARLFDKCRSTFPFVQCNRLLGGDARPRGVTGGTQHRRQRQAGVAVIDQCVGALGYGYSFLGYPPRLVVRSPARE